MQQVQKQHPQEQGPIEVQIGQKDSEEGQSAGQHSCQMLLSQPVMDNHAGTGGWTVLVLQLLLGHEKAGPLVSFFCPQGCLRVYHNVTGLDYSTLLVSHA